MSEQPTNNTGPMIQVSPASQGSRHLIPANQTRSYDAHMMKGNMQTAGGAEPEFDKLSVSFASSQHSWIP